MNRFIPPYVQALAHPSKWVTDKHMPLIMTGKRPTCFLAFEADLFRFEVRAHYTLQRMTAGYHMNDNNIPPFYWSKPR